MTSDPIILSAIIGASVSFPLVAILNFVKESLRQKRPASRRHEIWE